MQMLLVFIEFEHGSRYRSALLSISSMGAVHLALPSYPANKRFSKRSIVHVRNDTNARLFLQKFRQRLLFTLLRVPLVVVEVIKTDDGTIYEIRLNKIKNLYCRIVQVAIDVYDRRLAPRESPACRVVQALAVK